MKHIPTIAGALLGLAFIAFSLMVLLNLMGEQPAPAEGSYEALFMGAFAPSGYLRFVKVCELVGGVLVAIPKTRGAGLLVLGPILVNILAYHMFITNGVGLTEPMLLGIGALALICLLAEARALLRFAFKIGADS